jgi:hypothetical protein
LHQQVDRQQQLLVAAEETNLRMQSLELLCEELRRQNAWLLLQVQDQQQRLQTTYCASGAPHDLQLQTRALSLSERAAAVTASERART